MKRQEPLWKQYLIFAVVVVVGIVLAVGCAKLLHWITH